MNTSRIVEFLPSVLSRGGGEVLHETKYIAVVVESMSTKKSLSVCVLPPEGQQGMVKREKFRTFLRDLKRLRAWLKHCQVTEVAMESTGQYWRPVWNVLEGHVANLVLLNPAPVKGLAGRKTDRRDAEWLARLHERERRRGSFIPPVPLREMRGLPRSARSATSRSPVWPATCLERAADECWLL